MRQPSRLARCFATAVGQREYYSRIKAGVLLAKRTLGTPGVNYSFEGGPFLDVLERRVLGVVSPDGKS